MHRTRAELSGGEQSPPPQRVPEGLSWWRRKPGGAEWLDRLPRLAGECADQWGLAVGPAFVGAHVSFVAPVLRADGTAAVLKVSFPGAWENDREADALAHWDGRGAVRLLAYDPERTALLLERCVPGAPLSTIADDAEADAIAADVLLRLWRPAPPDHRFRLLAEDALDWADGFASTWDELGRPFEESLVSFAVEAARDLAGSQGEPIVLHQDFHDGNVLRAEREPWLAIDPQPLVGEREYDAASLLRDRPAESSRRLHRRLERLADALGVDRERTRRWAVVHALAWGVSGVGKVEPELVACARWLAAI